MKQTASGNTTAGDPAAGGRSTAASAQGDLFELAPAAAFVFGQDGSILRANPAAFELLQLEPGIVLGRSFTAYLDSVSARHFTEHLERVKAGGGRQHLAVKLQPQGDVGIRHLTLATRLIPANDRDPAAFLSIAVDLTEQQRTEETKKQLERQLVNTQRLESLGQLAGGVAHDFNNLLTGILGHAELLEMSDRLADSDRQCVAMMRKAATSAARLCQQMLASAGRSTGTLDAVNLNDAVADALSLVAVSLNKDITIVRRLAEDLPPIAGDFAQLNQAVLNLLINAEEAIGHEAGQIEIGTRLTRLEPGYRDPSFFGPEVPAGEYVELWVADSGVGMSPVTLSHIFDPFYTTKFTGRGLGLSTVFGTLRWHNGTIAVRSAPGVGATFRLFLPAQRAPAPRSGGLPRVRETRTLRGKRILLIDDEEPVRQVVTSLLERAGAEVSPAADGRTAVELFRERPRHFTHILLDLIMPGMNGEQTLAALRDLQVPLPPVVVLSGYATPDIQARLQALGVAAQLKKPCSIVQLAQELANAG